MSNWGTETIETDRLTFHCRLQGDPNGPPMLLLHGSSATGRWWEPLLEVLPDSLNVAAPDLRGCGLSGKPETGYAVADQAADIELLVEALGWHDIDLVVTHGGAVAIESALRRPDLLHTLTLADSVPIQGSYSPPETLRLLAEMRHDRALLRRALALLMPSLVSGIQDEDGEPAFFGLLVEDAAQMAPAAFTEIARSVSEWNRLPDAGRLTLPTLLIWGELDILVDRDDVTGTLLAIPGANNLEVLRGVGHCPMIEAPLTFAERLLDFIVLADAGETG